MALYERYEGGRKVERAFTTDGTARDLELRALAAAGLYGWKRTGTRRAAAAKKQDENKTDGGNPPADDGGADNPTDNDDGE